MEFFYQVLRTPTSILVYGILLLAFMLTFSTPRFREKKRLWIVLCLIPLVACLVHAWVQFPIGDYIIVSSRKTAQGLKRTYFPFGLKVYGMLYLSSLLALLLILCRGKGIWKRILSGLLCTGICYCGVSSIFTQIHYFKFHNFTHVGWTEGFEKSIETMRREYVLNDWKKIDYDSLTSKYLPLAQKAENAGDAAAFAEVLANYCYEFYDSHVSPSAPKDVIRKARACMAGNDYGLTLFTIDSGETLAFLVDEESDAYASGIREGTTVTQWDGIPVGDAVKDVECRYFTYGMRFPVKTNEDRFRPFFLAGKGGDTIEICFLDESGNEQTVFLSPTPSTTSYRARLGTAIDCLEHNWSDEENFTVRMLSETCGYLRVNVEKYKTLPDYVAYVRGGYYPLLMNDLHQKFTSLQTQGMQALVIDLRNNSGGLDIVAGALASMFTDEKRFMFNEVVVKNGKLQKLHPYNIFPDGRWKELPVVVLVNQECMSAGDGAAWFLSGCENVTLMGITCSNGVNQSVGGYCCISGGFNVHYPVAYSLDESGLPLIDTNETRENRIPLDVVIPVDKDAAMKIFTTDDDYELEFALQYLEQNTH